MTEEKTDREEKREDLPEPQLPVCEKCKKDPFKCPCGTWEDLDK